MNYSIDEVREAEDLAYRIYGGRKHVPFADGKEITSVQKGCSIPDLYRSVNGINEAIEVKSLDFSKGVIHDRLIAYRNQLTFRAEQLPPDTKQRLFIVLRNTTDSVWSIDDLKELLRFSVSNWITDLDIDLYIKEI